MSPRELVILILGLAIIAVVLRGLFVAMQGRRGQLRLAIDKNIPRDVDLNALELAELPSGGARVVARSFAEVNRQNHVVANAATKATTMQLGDRVARGAPIPVLMDPVVLNTDAQQSALRVAITDAIAENADSVLFDYGTPSRAVDNLSQVAPDYPDDDEDEDDLDEDDFDDDYDSFEEDDDQDEDDVESADEPEDDDDIDDDEFADDDADDEDEFNDDDDFDAEEFDPLDEEDEDDLVNSDLEDELGYVDDDLDEFSMTAGERIGFTASNSKPAHQSSLFGDEGVVPPEKAKRKPLFAAFSRKAINIEPPKVTSKAVPPQPSSMSPSEAVTSKPKMTEKPQVIVAKPEPARIAPVQESQRAKATVVEPVYEKVAAEPSEVVVINVMAKPGRTLLGDDLLHVLITSSMKFGDMNIFHRRLGGESKGPIIFSIANILNPGTFDLNRMHEFTTMGVSLFLALPTAIKNLDAFDQMLNVAQQICGALDGELRDDNRNLMTAQTIEHYRQRIRDFELRRLKAVGARG